MRAQYELSAPPRFQAHVPLCSDAQVRHALGAASFYQTFPVKKGILRCHTPQERNQGPRVRVHGKSGRAPALFIPDGVVITVPTQWCLRNDLAPRLRQSTSARSAPAHTSRVGRARWHFTSARKARKLTCRAHAVTVGASTLEAPLHSATPSWQLRQTCPLW